jgi:hypothetical protein
MKGEGCGAQVVVYIETNAFDRAAPRAQPILQAMPQRRGQAGRRIIATS